MVVAAGSPRRARLAVGALALALVGAQAAAEPLVLRLDPATTQVRFTLGATLHTVEGSLRLERGEISFHPTGGLASGRVVIDARSADTGIDSRDEVMHETVLESAQHPEIVFEPRRLVIVERDGPDRGAVRLEGTLAIHGARHDVAIPARVEREGRNVWIDASFEVPYVAWGMQDPSTFVLRVADTVTVTVDAVARVQETTAGR